MILNFRRNKKHIVCYDYSYARKDGFLLIPDTERLTDRNPLHFMVADRKTFYYTLSRGKTASVSE